MFKRSRQPKAIILLQRNQQHANRQWQKQHRTLYHTSTLYLRPRQTSHTTTNQLLLNQKNKSQHRLSQQQSKHTRRLSRTRRNIRSLRPTAPNTRTPKHKQSPNIQGQRPRLKPIRPKSSRPQMPLDTVEPCPVPPTPHKQQTHHTPTQDNQPPTTSTPNVP